jgi:hypothetical protein
MCIRDRLGGRHPAAAWRDGRSRRDGDRPVRRPGTSRLHGGAGRPAPARSAHGGDLGEQGRTRWRGGGAGSPAWSADQARDIGPPRAGCPAGRGDALCRAAGRGCLVDRAWDLAEPSAGGPRYDGSASRGKASGARTVGRTAPKALSRRTCRGGAAGPRSPQTAPRRRRSSLDASGAATTTLLSPGANRRCPRAGYRRIR